MSGAAVVFAVLLPNPPGLEHAGPVSATLRAQSSDAAITPFTIAVPERILTDLNRRLAQTRFPDEIENSGWEYGTNLAYLRELVTYWRTTFDWRDQERRLNQMPQFITRIDGLDLHFVHQRSSRVNAIPLVFIHGWPGSIVEVTKIIGPLTNPTAHGGRAEDAFHVVAISLPGYGFSAKAKEPGMSNRRIAAMIAQLMARLGYTRYGAQGGDWGGFIVRQLGLVDPEHLIGLHSNLCIAGPPAGAANPNEDVPPDELKRAALARTRAATETAYSQLHGTKPQTLGYALNDSPAGLAAWIVEKFHGWSDSAGNVETRFTKDELLTNIMIYWATETGPSSIRLYYENRRDPGAQGRVEVPFACARFPMEPFLFVPRRWVEASYNLVQFTDMPRGGHFAALEEPDLLVEDVRRFFRGRR